MADYSTIKGFNIQSLATDPYASVEASGTWASTNNTNTGRRGPCGFGTRTAAVAAGGNAPPVGVLCETYDGSSWSEVNPLNSPRAAIGPGAGSQTAGLCAAGNAVAGDIDNAEKWDGTCWTETADLQQIRHSGACMGATNTAAVYSGGSNYPPGTGAEGYLVETETWDGTSWTEAGDLSTGRRYVAGVGPSTAAFLLGGAIPPGSTSTGATETWDGTSWTNSVIFNTARRYLAASGGATAQTGALIFGGTSPTVALTEYFNGTAWTEIADMGTAKLSQLGSTIGSTVSALSAFGGPPNPTASEEFVASGTNIAGEGQVWYNTSGAVLKGFGKVGTLNWSGGSALNTARRQLGGAGSGSTSAIAFGGRTSDPVTTDVSETYNGSTWTEGNNLLQARYTGAGFGVETAALYVTGFGQPTATAYTNTEIYDGTSWTETNNINLARGYTAGCGTTSGGLCIGGYTVTPPARLEAVEDFNGTSWTEVADLQTTDTNSLMAAVQGTPSAALAFGGYPGPSARTEKYDGSTWTEVNNLSTARSNGMGSGTQTAALAIGGNQPPVSPSELPRVEVYDGTSWTESSYDLGTGRYYGMAAGSSTNAITAGAQNYTGITEELAGAPAIKTFTSS